MIEEKIFHLIDETVTKLGFELVKISIQSSKTKILQILIAKPDNSGIKIQDCKMVSKYIAPLLDVEDYIRDKYLIEVCSSGIERPLTKIENFKRFIGHEVKVNLKLPVNEKVKYKGTIIEVNDQLIKIQSKNSIMDFDFDNIKSANLVFTDEMFRAMLARGTKKSKK